MKRFLSLFLALSIAAAAYPMTAYAAEPEASPASPAAPSAAEPDPSEKESDSTPVPTVLVSRSEVRTPIRPGRKTEVTLTFRNLSKSTLLMAADMIIEKTVSTDYFPAYEIMMDDLRDYRFYASDMTHPSDVAVDYIWEKFKDAFFDNKERAKVDECERFSRRLSHRVMSGNPEVAERFRQDTRNALVSLVERYPHIKEIESIKQILN